MKKHFKIAIQMDPLEKINPKEDSTFVIAQEAQRRGYKLFHYSPKDISLKNNTIIAKGCYFKIINHILHNRHYNDSFVLNHLFHQ